MKRSFSVVTVILTFIILLSGCKSQSQSETNPYDSKVSSVNKTAEKIKFEHDISKKVSSLKDFEDDYQKYQHTKKPYKQVNSAYQHQIKTIKSAIQDGNKSTIKSASVSDSKEETQASLEKKISNLNDLKKEVEAEKEIVYTSPDFENLNKDIDKQIEKNKAGITSAILSTTSSKKYIDAYNQFSMQNNPKGESRGSTPRAKGFYETVGLSEKDYFAIYTGIFDYYGNAVEQGLITKVQSDDAFQEAQSKLLAGKYATKSTVIHNMNFYQIENGDYSGLIGSWKEISEGGSMHDGQGVRELPLTGQKLNITKYKINDSQVSMTQKDGGITYFTDQTGSEPATFDESDSLSVEATIGSQIYMIEFYPKGVPMAEEKDNSSKERIMIHSSNDSYYEIFERV